MQTIPNILTTISESYHLGSITESPTQIFGGLLHEMWKITTESGVFAVKLLNLEIMKRPEAYGNFVLSEKVANQAKNAGIPAVVALSTGEDSLIQIGERYCMVFPWVEGKTLSEAPAGEKASHAIGSILARIHNLSIESTPGQVYGEMLIDLKQLDILEKEFEGISAKILELQEKYNTSLSILNSESVMSHRDIDQKNVLWNNEDNPLIIDWEAAGPVNPIIELLMACIYWGGIVSGEVDKNSFQAVLRGYQEIHQIDSNLLQKHLYGCTGFIDWLMYNIQRREDSNVGLKEKELAEKEVRKTVAVVNVFYDKITIFQEWIQTVG